MRDGVEQEERMGGESKCMREREREAEERMREEEG